MPLISNGIKSKKVGKSGLDNRIYQPFYSFLEHFKKYAEINTEKVSLSTGPQVHKCLSHKAVLIFLVSPYLEASRDTFGIQGDSGIKSASCVCYGNKEVRNAES